MATGDVTINIVVEGGVTKTVVLPSATRVLHRARYSELGSDAAWQAMMVNKFGDLLNNAANKQQEATTVAGLTAPSFTAAT